MLWSKNTTSLRLQRNYLHLEGAMVSCWCRLQGLLNLKFQWKPGPIATGMSMYVWPRMIKIGVDIRCNRVANFVKLYQGKDIKGALFGILSLLTKYIATCKGPFTYYVIKILRLFTSALSVIILAVIILNPPPSPPCDYVIREQSLRTSALSYLLIL